ncbi:unnamed protein product [Toxocara canis]|uniref:CUB domain-containing protein n=1 Tax=Toxocara canis TaxID=6265 RepID=A0A183UXB5_TOXCA|nr:unnamed protein product [Toxocara canis]
MEQRRLWHCANGKLTLKPDDGQVPKNFTRVWRSSLPQRSTHCLTNINIHFSRTMEDPPSSITVEYDADTKGFCEFRSLDNGCVTTIKPPQCIGVQNVSEMGNSLQFICCCNGTHLCNHGGYKGGHIVLDLRDPE